MLPFALLYSYLIVSYLQLDCKLLDSRNHIFSLVPNTILYAASIFANVFATLKSIIMAFPQAFHTFWGTGICAEWQKFSCLMRIFQDEVNQAILTFRLESHTRNKSSFCSRFSAIFFALFWFLLEILLFKLDPKHGTEVLSSIFKFKKAEIYLRKKIRVLSKFHSDISYSVANCEFNVNKSMIYSK